MCCSGVDAHCNGPGSTAECQRKALGCIARKKPAPDPEQMHISVHAPPTPTLPLELLSLEEGGEPSVPMILALHRHGAEDIVMDVHWACGARGLFEVGGSLIRSSIPGRRKIKYGEWIANT